MHLCVFEYMVCVCVLSGVELQHVSQLLQSLGVKLHSGLVVSLGEGGVASGLQDCEVWSQSEQIIKPAAVLTQ